MDILFRDYKEHKDAKLNHALLWDADYDKFDLVRNIDLVIKRVISRGGTDDWYFMLNFYGFDKVKEKVLEMPIDPDYANLLSLVFSVPVDKLILMAEERAHWWNNL